jgi:hypothetical protein
MNGWNCIFLRREIHSHLFSCILGIGTMDQRLNGFLLARMHLILWLTEASGKKKGKDKWHSFFIFPSSSSWLLLRERDGELSQMQLKLFGTSPYRSTTYSFSFSLLYTRIPFLSWRFLCVCLCAGLGNGNGEAASSGRTGAHSRGGSENQLNYIILTCEKI